MARKKKKTLAENSFVSDNGNELQSFSESEIQTVEMVYIGSADVSTIRGAVTKSKYRFIRDRYGMPVPLKVDERDSAGILSKLSDACCGNEPEKIYMTKVEWDIDIKNAKRLNRVQV